MHFDLRIAPGVWAVLSPLGDKVSWTLLILGASRHVRPKVFSEANTHKHKQTQANTSKHEQTQANRTCVCLCLHVFACVCLCLLVFAGVCLP